MGSSKDKGAGQGYDGDVKNLLSAYAAAEMICRRHAKSFYFASHFLPERKRRRAYAVYAFCRLLDDAVDEAASRDQQEKRLELFENLLTRCYSGEIVQDSTTDSLALQAFSMTVRECHIPKRLFHELAEGCRMDLTTHRYPDWKSLERYCYHVAGVVGLIMCHVFEVPDSSVHQQAICMGNAMQLTNILRDVGEDADRGRIYIPQNELKQFGVDEIDLLNKNPTPAFKHLMRFQIDRARMLYQQASQGLCELASDGSRQTACVMASVYSGILQAIEKQDYDVFSQRAHLGLMGKLKRLGPAMRLCQLEYADRVPDVF